jgi:uncharacterized protein involved in exopolysaccharide biosynthesis
MTRVIGPRSGSSGGQLSPHVPPAIPVNFSPLGGGDWEEDELSRQRRRRLRWRRAGGAALALVGAAAGLAFASQIYEARDALLIRPPGGNGTVPKATDGALAAEMEILRSSDVVRQAIERVGVEALYPGLESEPVEAALASATDRVQSGLVVRTLPGSDVIEVTFRHGRAEVAADTVNRLVERYQELRRATLAPAASSERFLSDRIAEQRQALADTEARLAVFHAENPATAAADPRRAIADRRVAIETELRTLRDAIDRERAVGQTEDPSVARARARLDELELEEQQILNTHVEGSRAVAKIRHEIGLVRDYLATKEQTASREQGRRLEVLRSRQRELEAELGGLGQGERHLPELERQVRELERERDVAARRLDAYQRELETATLAADVDEHRVAVAVHVLESARPPTFTVVPVGRARVAWALTGAAGVALIGAGVSDWLERRRRRRAPAIWTAHVGAGAEGGPVALLVGNQQQRGGSPVVLLLGGSEKPAPPAPGEPPAGPAEPGDEER